MGHWDTVWKSTLVTCYVIHTSNSLKLIISMSHSWARSTSSSWNASMITIVFTDVPLPLTQSRTIQAFSGTSQITVEMVAGTERTVLNDPLCTGVSDAGQRASVWYLCRWCSRWPPYPECHTAEPSPGSMCNRPILKWSTEREKRWYILLYSFISCFVKDSCWCYLFNCVRWVSVLYLWPVYGENADKLVASMRVASVQECGANVLGSVCHLCKKKKKYNTLICIDW